MGVVEVYYCDICHIKVEPPLKTISMSHIDQHGDSRSYSISYSSKTMPIHKLILCQEHSEMIRIMIREELKKYMKRD